MCGLVGVWNYASRHPVDRYAFGLMTDELAHRGPDDRGLHFDDAAGIALGFRRLSILDLSPAGHQPMANEDESVWLLGNGELYDHEPLRTRLQASGHVFRSRSDMECALHLYEEMGPSLAAALRGMFAIALWDAKARRLTLVRDRLGKKPLYVWDDGRRIVFGSEAKAVVRDREIPREVDDGALAEYLALGSVAAPRTIFKGLRKLPPASVLVHENGVSTITRYWDWRPAFDAPPFRDEGEAVEAVRASLLDAVRVRLASDVPLGVFLSGGLDSSAVTAAFARLGGTVRTFAVGFAGASADERPFAKAVAEHCGTQHTELVVEPASPEALLPRISAHFDEPFADSSALPTYLVSKAARDGGVTVCLSGDGGDEALAGYTRYAAALRGQWLDRVPLGLRHALLAAPRRLVGPFARGRLAVERGLVDADGRYALAMQTFAPSQVQALMPRHRVAAMPGPLAGALNKARGLDLLSRMQYVDAETYLPDDILVKVDRMSMLASLEVRSPLLDHHFLELCARVPAAWRLRDGQPKAFWKRVLSGWLPEAVLDRPKQGFGLPGQSWLSAGGQRFAREILLDGRTRRRGLVRGDLLPGLLGRLARHPGTWPQVHALVVLELWARARLDESR